MLKPLAALACFFLIATFIQADDGRYVEGQHYRALSSPLKITLRDGEIGEIIEFFSYGCIHCYNLEPAVERFLEEKPDNIRFTRVPVMFNERQAPEVRAYYVLELRKLGEEAHLAIFNAIHRDRRNLRTDEAFASFFEEEFGIPEDQYMRDAYSFAVNAKVNTSIYMTGNSQITGTPSIVANGEYFIDAAAIGSNELALYAAKWVVENKPAN